MCGDRHNKISQINRRPFQIRNSGRKKTAGWWDTAWFSAWALRALGWDNPLLWGLSCPLEDVSSMCDLYSLDDSSTGPSCGNQKCLQILLDAPQVRGAKVPLAENQNNLVVYSYCYCRWSSYRRFLWRTTNDENKPAMLGEFQIKRRAGTKSPNWKSVM